jgi:hypothetical protein
MFFLEEWKMKKSIIVAKPKLLFICLLVLTLLSISAYATVNLGTAANFAVLGSSGVTNAESGTHITGDVGSWPTEAVTGLNALMVTGNLYFAGDATPVKAQAHDDASVAYTAAFNTTGSVAGPANLGGAILAPGVYKYNTTAAWADGSGDLTLDATLDGPFDPNAQWIFQIGTDLTTPADVSVLLIHGASANNVFWQIGTDFTLGARNTFAGNILAGAGITLGGGTLNGRALAGTLVSIPTATIINAPMIPEPATLCLLGLGALGLLRKRRA